MYYPSTKSTKRSAKSVASFVLFFCAWFRATPADLAPAEAKQHDWKRDVYLWLPLACLSWWLAWYFQDRFITDWDGFDYTTYTVQHRPTALGLGRALFLGYNYLLWEAAHRWLGVLPDHAYLVIRYGVIAQVGPAIIGMYALCKELTAKRAAAFLGALLLAASPYFIAYSGRAMSEIPAFFMLSWALWWMLRSLRTGKTASFILAACLVGLSANLREFAVFYLPVIPLAAWWYRQSWKLCLTAFALATLCALAGMIFWASFDYLYLPAVITWYGLSAAERRANPVTVKNFWFLAKFAFHCSATMALLSPLALTWLWSRRPQRPLFWLGLSGLGANLILLANHDLAVNPRYLLTGLLGLAPACGWCLAELFRWQWKRGTMVAAGLAALTLATYLHEAKELYQHEWAALAAQKYIRKIEGLPWNAGFIVGMRTPLVSFLAGVEARPFWRVIAPGAGWPDDKLDQAIQDFFYAGREVYVDFDPELWQTGEREKSREAAGLAMIKQCYRLRHIRDDFYQILPPPPRRNIPVQSDFKSAYTKRQTGSGKK